MTNAQHSTKSHAAGSTRGNGLDRNYSIDFASFPNPMFGLAQVQAVMARMFLTQQKEMLDFLSHRCSQNLQMANQIVAAKEPKVVSDIVNDFYRNAFREYSEEMGRAVDSGPRAVAAASEATRDLMKSHSEPAVHAQSV
jgi:hypothetical protein